ncbi:MAG: hypothetical protein MUF87_13980 [Anaerolineae bacterium]|jgi:O-antigen/teichoic acid export membrane protein|nr:hypothetical protein [Anaerolineae bacterium]
MQFIFFFAFALVIVTMYLAIRRGWGNLRVIAALGVCGSIVTMSLTMISQPNVRVDAGVIAGVLIGGAFGAATLAIAWYFQTQELRAKLPPESEV